jgi:hypothetical protein
MTPSYPCPTCRRPLRSEPGKAEAVAVWCPHSQCRSKAAEDGAEGATVEQAVGRLIEAVEASDDVTP